MDLTGLHCKFHLLLAIGIAPLIQYRTLVDVPGLIHATNKSQTEADKELILDLVQKYMKNPRTIILAVVSAKNDFANQVILDHVSKIDSKGERTLGIITKPDYLREGSQNEADWIELARNKNIYFKLGWHMLKNRADNEMEFTFTERNEAEKVFFSKGRYQDLSRDIVGIESLRGRLSKLLLKHLIKELPSLKIEILTKLQSTVEKIRKLGEKRSTVEEQRMTLVKISMDTHDILKSSVKGSYENDFFGTPDMSNAIDSTHNIRRFRAVIQYLNTRFARNMRLIGHKYTFGSDLGDGEDDVSDAGTDKSSEGEEQDTFDSEGHHIMLSPQEMTHQEAIRWVRKALERSRGFELPGTFNPDLISQLFWEQSRPWEELASVHINDVAHKCQEFVHTVLRYTSPVEFQDRLAAVSVDAALQRALVDCKEELRKIIADKSRHPMTYNHYFTTTLLKIRRQNVQKHAEKLKELPRYPVTFQSGEAGELVDPNELEVFMTTSAEQNMDNVSAEEALACQCAYYKVIPKQTTHFAANNDVM